MTTHSIDNQNELPTNRDQAWLEKQLQTIWSMHFYDIEQLNTVTIRWGRASRTRLGTITARGGRAPHNNPEISEIRVNPLLKDPAIPQSVVWQTIAHEVAHYCHGFCSPHPRKFDHPHRGNVIQKELMQRNLDFVYNDAQIWLKKNWQVHVAATIGTKTVKRRKRRSYGQRKSVSLLSDIRKVFRRRRRLGR